MPAKSVIPPWFTDGHAKWFSDTGQRIKTADGREVQIWEFKPEDDAAIMKAWAKHFRNHYCPDDEIEALRGELTCTDFLTTIKFPAKDSKLGPSTRAGDFGEILISDFIQWQFKHLIHRVRWDSKLVRDESAKGNDIIGFSIIKPGSVSSKDSLFIAEVKTAFSSQKDNRLQDAIAGSAKDEARLAESLHYIKQRMLRSGFIDEMKKIERFQSIVDHPYEQTFGAVAVFSSEYFKDEHVTTANCQEIKLTAKSKSLIAHPKIDQLRIFVIKGKSMMALVHKLYEKAANEA